MPQIACPKCRGKLQIPTGLRGQVRCPHCAVAFSAALGPGNSPPLPSQARPTVRFKCPLCGALYERPEKFAGEILSCPSCHQRIEVPRAAPKGAVIGEVVEVAISSTPTGTFPPASQSQRHYPPHRGSLVLVLGLVSVLAGVMGMFTMCCVWPPGAFEALGLALGIPAWMLGQADLTRMAANQLDHAGRELTRGGWICGIIGTALSGLAMLIFFGWMVFAGWTVITDDARRSRRIPQPTIPSSSEKARESPVDR